MCFCSVCSTMSLARRMTQARGVAAPRAAPAGAVGRRGTFQNVPTPRSAWSNARARQQSPSLALEAAASDVVEAAEAPQVSDREAVAYLRNLRGSPNKVRRVLDAIRGMSYEEALMALEFMPYRACDDILKVLYSVSSPTQTQTHARALRHDHARAQDLLPSKPKPTLSSVQKQADARFSFAALPSFPFARPRPRRTRSTTTE